MMRMVWAALALVLAGAASAEPALPAVTVAAVEVAALRDRVIASGLIGPVEQVQVQPQIEGQAIDALLADVGDRVEAGAPLARLSTKALILQKIQLQASRASTEAALAQAEAQLVEAQASAEEADKARERTLALRQQGNVSAATAETAIAAAAAADARVSAFVHGRRAATAQLDVVDAQIADVELNLARTIVEAPVAGTILSRNAMLGAIASAAGEPMFVLMRDSLVELRADVSERDLLRLAPGQAVSLRVVGVGEALTGRVRLVEPSVDAATRLGRVRIALDQPDAVRPGLFAEAEILVADRRVPSVPASAVSNGADGASVLVVAGDGTVERRAVTTGIRDGDRVEVVAGLVEGERVVARAGAFVRPGDRVNAVAAGQVAQATN